MGLIAHYKVERENMPPMSALGATIRAGVDRILGIEEYKKLDETLYYFLNSYCDIKSVPVAEGGLRKLQICDLELLKIFDIICKKHGLSYWLDYGTLLGAYRHGGFIPWDDDLDVGMKRTDYAALTDILKVYVKEYGFEFEDVDNLIRIGLGYKENMTGIKIDVFPVDICSMNGGAVDDVEDSLKKRILKYRNYYDRNFRKKNAAELAGARKKIIHNTGNFKIAYHAPEFHFPIIVLHDLKSIFPLRKIEFEGIWLPCPRDVEGYLRRIYGNDYMSFPRSGVEHHKYNGVRLSDFAEKNHINMEQVAAELSAIANKINSR